MHPSINMDKNKKQIVEASSSSTMNNFDYLFGPRKPSSTLSSSSTLFDSIFPPSSFVGGRDWRKQNMGGKNYGASGTHNSKGESSGSRICNKSTSSNDQNVEVEPSYFSSSIYYGGQENYFPRSRTITEPHHHVFYKKGEVDDPNGKDSSTASRGNWWEGSLYY